MNKNKAMTILVYTGFISMVIGEITKIPSISLFGIVLSSLMIHAFLTTPSKVLEEEYK